MWPDLLTVGGHAVPSYAVFMILGYLAALATLRAVARSAPKEEGLTWFQVKDLYLVMVVSSLLGAKIGHTLFEARGHVDREGQPIDGVIELLRDDPFHWAAITEPGYVWYGGLVTALAVATFYFWRRPKLDAWAYADAFAPAIMIGAFFGRIGCFLAGCCHGRATDAWVGVHFPALSGPVHPTQLYDAGIALLVGLLLWGGRARRPFRGASIAVLLVAYGVFRATTEVFRGDTDRGLWGPLSTSQWISIPIILTGLGIFLVRGRSEARASPGHPEAAP